MKIGIVSGYQNTKDNPEDLALTPYLHLVLPNPNEYKTYGIGVCWIYYSIFIGVSFNLPNELSRFIWLSNL